MLTNYKNQKLLKSINAFIDSNVNKNKNYEWQLGYKNFGILLFGFCRWIHEQSEIDEVEKIFFLARDGYIVKQVYELIYPNEKTGYLYVSRRSLALPSMKDAKKPKDILNCLVLPPMFTIDVLLAALDLKMSDVRVELRMANINKNEKFIRSNLKENSKILSLLELIFEKINKKAEEQYKNFTNYLEQEDFSGKVGIVDIGWHNSIQKALLNISKNTKIKGYYLGIYRDANQFQNGNNAKGYLYSYGDNIDFEYQTFSFVSLLETFFLAPEGTTMFYQKKDEQVVPILREYEYSNELDSSQLIRNFQDGAIQFVKQYINSGLQLSLNKDVCSYNIVKLGSSPNKKNIKVFERLSFENYKVHNIINFNHNSLFYLLHPQNMIEDFYSSGWRVAFLKKMFKLPLPYYQLFHIICIALNNKRRKE